MYFFGFFLNLLHSCGIIGQTVFTGSEVDTPPASIEAKCSLCGYLTAKLAFDPAIAVGIYDRRFLLREI